MYSIEIDGSFIYKTTLEQAKKYIKDYCIPRGRSYKLWSPDNRLLEQG